MSTSSSSRTRRIALVIGVAALAIAVVAPTAEKRIAARPAEHDIGARIADERIGAGRACVGDGIRDVAAEDDVTLAGIIDTARVGATGSDDNIVEAVAVDISAAANRFARKIICIDAVETEYLGLVKRG